MSAQPTVTVHDYLSEVRIFHSSSAEFAQAASDLGVSASLATLGEGLSLVAAVRNDSGQAVELCILFEVTKAWGPGKTSLEVDRTLAAGEVTLVAPRGEIDNALMRLLYAARPHQSVGRLVSVGGLQPQGAYEGAQVTVSIDSATLADGQFIGANTQKRKKVT